MAVFPDRIVLKNSTDSQATIESAIGSGGTDEITQGEIVLGIENTQVKFYTKSGNGNIVTLGGTGAGAPAMTDITDVDLSTPATDGQVLMYSSSSGNWEPGANSPLTTDGDIIIRSGGADTRLGIGTDGQVLKVSSGLPVWAAGSASAIDDLTDVDTSTVAPTDGQALVWDNTAQQWEPGTVASGSVASIDDIGDVDTSTVAPTDGQALLWDNTAQKWEPRTVSGGGAVTSVNTQTGAVSLGVEDLDDFLPQVTPPVAAYHDQKQSTDDSTGVSNTTGGWCFVNDGNTYTYIYINAQSPTSGTSLYGQGFVDDTTLDLWVSADGVNFTQHTATSTGGNSSFISFNELSPSLSAYSSATALYFSLTSVAGTPIALADGDILQYESGTSKFRPVQLGVDDLSDVDTSTVAPTDGQALVWDNTAQKWEPGTVSGGTTLPTAQDGEALIYENGQWVAGPVIGGVDYTTSGGDASFNNVELLLLFNGTNGSTTFTDSSSNGLTVTASGNAQISTAQSKFGGASGYFDGTGDKIVVASDPGLAFGASDDFTIEFWFRPTHNNVYEDGAILISDAATSFTTGVSMIIWNHPSVPNDISVWNYADSTNKLIGTSSLTPGTWYHIALVRSGTTVNLYVDGTAGTSATSNGAWDFSDGGTAIGDYFGGGFGSNGSFDGYIDDLRVTKGVARYTSNFTAPTAELPTTDGTVAIPYSINKLDDVDTSTVAPTDGQALVWDNANSQWEPGTVSGAVTSVNTQTGAVSLGIEDLDDFQLQATPPTSAYHDQKQSDGDFTSVGNTTGSFALDQAGTGYDAIYISKTPTSGTGLMAQGFVAGTSLDLYVSADGSTFTQHTATGSFEAANRLRFAGLSPGLSAYSSATALYFSLTSVAGTPIALADGDILQYESATSKFRPVQAAGVRSLLGIGEYADDTAAGTGGLSSGELYYNTTSSSYVLKT